MVLSLLEMLSIRAQYGVSDLVMACKGCKAVRCKTSCVAFPEEWVEEIVYFESEVIENG